MVQTNERTPGADPQALVRERLRALIRRIEQRPPRRAPPPPPRTPSLPGTEPRQTSAGECLYREVRYGFDDAFGAQPLGALTQLDEDALALLEPTEDFGGVRLEDLLFVDIETTGLGGAGAAAFLVAASRVEPDAGGPTLVLRQYIAPAPGAEAALLTALLEDAPPSGDPVLVTYNGRAFDAPVLDGRLTMHRLRGSFEALRHVDLLQPARWIYRSLPSRRLARIEADVLGFTRPSGDVSGAEIPRWYFRFLRSGDPRVLAPLMRHNELDVVALAALLGRFASALSGAWTPRGAEALGFGRLLARRGRPEPARRHLEAALPDLPPSLARDESLTRLAALHKRSGRPDLAEPLWREAASRPGAAAIEPLVELAMHHEHRTRDLPRACVFVEQALAVAAGPAQLEALRHRHERVRRKIERQVAEPDPRTATAG